MSADRVLCVGVLALQGAFARHLGLIESLGHRAVAVRHQADLDGIDALILPGGESTTMSMMLDANDLRAALSDLVGRGLPLLGTCAGMILAARQILDGRSDQVPFAAIDLVVRRNGFGRQIDSFETDLDIAGLDTPFHAVFIRAPVVTVVGSGVEVLACVGDQPVLCRSGPVMVAAFHPELSDDTRVHRLFLDAVEPRGRSGAR